VGRYDDGGSMVAVAHYGMSLLLFTLPSADFAPASAFQMAPNAYLGFHVIALWGGKLTSPPVIDIEITDLIYSVYNSPSFVRRLPIFLTCWCVAQLPTTAMSTILTAVRLYFRGRFGCWRMGVRRVMGDMLRCFG
jgi:hypothetical protein